MECFAKKCRWNHNKACLFGASPAAEAESKAQIAATGSTWFTPHVEINEKGCCANFERIKK